MLPGPGASNNLVAGTDIMQRYDKLMIVTEHKPLVKLFSDKITNPSLFYLKKHTLYGNSLCNTFLARKISFLTHILTSSNNAADNEEHTNTLALDCVHIVDTGDPMEDIFMSLAAKNVLMFKAITWEVVRQATAIDHDSKALSELIRLPFHQTHATFVTPIRRVFT